MTVRDHETTQARGVFWRPRPGTDGRRVLAARWSLALLALTAVVPAALCQDADTQRPAENASESVSPDLADSRAVAEPEAFGRRIRITLPITDSDDRTIKQVIARTLDQVPNSADRPIMVFEFSPPKNSEGAGSEFERCLALARYLTSPALDRVRTVAYIPRAAIGHAVLVVSACEQIVMHPDAVLGDAGVDEESIGPTLRGGYTEIARRRLTIPVGIALGMLDAQLEIQRVTTDAGMLYTWPEELARLRDSRTDIREIKTVVPSGRAARFRGDELRDMGLVSYLVNTDEEMASVLKLSPGQLEFDPSIDGSWRAIRLDLNGPINGTSVERVMRTVQQQRDKANINFVCVQIDSAGGNLLESVRLANFLAGLDSAQVRSVAYVPREARGDAMLVAFACDHLVAHPDAVLGGGGAVSISEQEVDDTLPTLQDIAQRKGKTWSVVAAMLKPGMSVYRYSQATTKRVAYLAEDEYVATVGEPARSADDVDAGGEWIRGEAVTTPDALLQLDGRQAEVLGLARFVVDDESQLQQLYQLPSSPELIGPNWAFDLIDALASPQLAGLLLFVGGFALFAELSSPGIGLGGFLAAVCFVLYFWANFLHGTAEVLEVLLFLTGIACILVEIFIIPGFGIFGLGGATLVVASLVLASQTFVFPTNDYQLRQLSQSMLMVTLVGGGLLVSLVAFRRYVSHLPFFGRIVLQPPAGEDLDDLSRRETVVDYDYLVGQIGKTRTQLTPSGKAVFGQDVVDVITEGDVVGRGEPVQVVDAQGNRVVVRAVKLPS